MISDVQGWFFRGMVARAKKKKAPTVQAAATTAAAGDWEAEKLTGIRAQSGTLANGTPRWTYEVKWKGTR